MTSACDSRNYRRGFSLTELAIVLSVAGMIFGGIWAISRDSSEDIAQQRTAQQITMVSTNVRALYQGRASIDNGDRTDELLHQNAIPLDMHRAGTTAPNMLADHGWGATAGVGTGGFVVTGQGNSFDITLNGLTAESCIALALAVGPMSGAVGILQAEINDDGILFTAVPISLNDAETGCVNPNFGNSIRYNFRLRQNVAG